MINTKKISVVGLGKLGFPYSISLAQRGFTVLGIDVNKKVIAQINQCVAPLSETGSQELLSRYKKRLQVSTDPTLAITKTDVTVILVPTPSDKKDNFSNIYVKSALKSLSLALKSSTKKFHLFIIGCTVMPQSCDTEFIPLIRKYSGRSIAKGFGLCYVPDFVALGSVIKDFLHPDMVIIGQSDNTSGNLARNIYRKFCLNKPPVFQMSLLSAEIAKMSLNAYLTLKISFANLLGNLCQKLPETDVDIITQAIGSDTRIGSKFLKAGLSFGGTCFPRDTNAFAALSNRLKVPQDLPRAINKINAYQDEHLFNLASQYLHAAPEKQITVLGLSFKAGTPVIEAAPAITLIRKLLQKGVKITVFDKQAINAVKKIFANRLTYKNTVAASCQTNSVVVLAHPDKKMAQQCLNVLKKLKKPVTIIDCWRMFKDMKITTNIKVVN